MDPGLKIIEECAIEICKFFHRDPDETIYVPIGGSSLTVQRQLYKLVAGRVFEAVSEISKLAAMTPPKEPNGG